MVSVPIKFYPIGELARIVERHEKTVRSALLEGKIPVDAILVQKNRRGISLFSEESLIRLKVLMGDQIKANP